ncbi:MAG: peptidase U62 [Elusimicrobiota bacterium]|jgi:TldD protein|nr:peptidase U62 [Elusimicrobiota bacterium]
MKNFLTLLFLSALTLGAQAAYTADTDPVLKTMRAEALRSVKKLSKASPPVYFLSYQITRSFTYNLSSVLGETADNSTAEKTFLDIEARAGSRQMDSTRKIKELSVGNMSYQRKLQPADAPLEIDETALKRALWLNTEEVVKTAQERYQKVQTNSATASKRVDDSADFSAPQAAQKYYAGAQKPALDEASLQAMLNGYSALFKGYDFIYSSMVFLSARVDGVYYVNSEGAILKTPQVLMRLSYELYTRNPDGMQLQRNKSYDMTSLGGLPAKEQVEKDIKQSIEELRKLKNAPVADTFHGPVILKNRATGVFFHEILGHRVEGHRQKDDDFGQTFTQKLGQQVISPIISVYDDPNLKEFNGVPLRGHYLYDDEGTRAQRASIVENGILKGFLMGRSPIKGFEHSNGHGRKEPGNPNGVVSRMGVTVIEASQSVPFDKLKQMLKEEIKKQGKPYGLLIEDIAGGFTNTDTFGPQSFKVEPLLVYKVYPDNRPDEIIRGADIVGTPLASFNKIAAAANDSDVFNGSCGAESGWVPVSAIAPSVLITEMEIEKMGKTYDGPPILPPPSAAQTKGGK